MNNAAIQGLKTINKHPSNFRRNLHRSLVGNHLDLRERLDK